ncbi:hypothetical protein [Microvirga lenta]|uniref:hypothetical protein n=1 Tax=Microvirga lenta TaxID=2881337 RepID=UPI001CFFF681|nr:hypothetical protein [Microvirga lenta]MCB5177498.1 hypothetical protein [Microvirga lenta]
MSVLLKLQQRKTAYLPVGLCFAAIALAALGLGQGGRGFVEDMPTAALFAYELATGTLLVLSLLWQWRLYFVRRSRDARRLQRAYRQHRWLGLVPMGLLVVHMGPPGANLLSAMTCLLLVSCLSGLFNNEIVRQRAGWVRTAWLVAHVGSAAFILPLVVLHIWAVLAFRVH